MVRSPPLLCAAVLAGCAGAPLTPAPKAASQVGTEPAMQAAALRACDVRGSSVTPRARLLDGSAILVDVVRSAISGWPGVVTGGRLRALCDPRLAGLGWAGAAADDSGRILGVLDSVVEGPAWELVVVVSNDGGATWSLRGTIAKPYYLAVVDRVVLDDPRGECVEMVLGDDYGSGVRTGRYRACSRDGGRVWARPA